MTASWRVPTRTRVLAPLSVSLAQALLVLGPALGRGVVITYDMPWSPAPRWTPFVLGVDTPAPRAVPSDAFAVLLGKVVGASVAQHLVLLAILVGLGLGAAALLAHLVPKVRTVGLCVAAVAAVWNPFVSERLVVGQWVVLLGLAALPWGVRAALRVAAGRTRAGAVAPSLAVASLGGANSLVLVAAGVLPILLCSALGYAVRGRSTPSLAPLGLGLLVTAGGAAVWALPGLTADLASTGSSARAFVPVADSPLGVVGSLASGGGFWNAAAHPSPRQQLVVAVVAAVLALLGVFAAWLSAGSRDRVLVLVPLVGALALVLVSVTEPLSGVWRALVTEVPGGGLLRDSHKFMALWVVTAAAGLGSATHRILDGRLRAVGVPVAALALGLPVALSPQLVWGVSGRLDSVVAPAGYVRSVEALADLSAGDVGLLPWSQYRRYGWNDDRVSLTMVPRIADRTVLFNDALPLRSGVVPGESRRAAVVSQRITDGASEAEALRDVGVRFVAVELAAGFEVDTAPVRELGVVVVDTPELLVVDVGGEEVSSRGGPALYLGWGVSGLTLLIVIVWGVASVPRRRLLASLLRFRS